MDIRSIGIVLILIGTPVHVYIVQINFLVVIVVLGRTRNCTFVQSTIVRNIAVV